MAIGNNIKNFRSQHGLFQVEFANVAGVSFFVRVYNKKTLLREGKFLDGNYAIRASFSKIVE